MNRSKLKELFSGIFLLIGFFAIFFIFYKIGKKDSFNKNNSYTIKAIFSDIGNLRVNAPVKVGGVQVGSVDNIYLDQESMFPVVVLLIAANLNKIPSDSLISISTAGIMGSQYLSVTLGVDDKYLVHNDVVENTNSAIYLEQIINSFLVHK